MQPRAKYLWIIGGLIALSFAIVALMLLEYVSIPIGLVLIFSLDPVILITAVMMNAENEK
jgi:hypothetical protein